MNKSPIENSNDPDMRLIGQALKRAAKRAHEIALEKGTTVVVSRNGNVEYIQPDPSRFESVKEPESNNEKI